MNNVYYRTNYWGIWHKYTAGDVLILENIGDYVQFWNNSDKISEYNNLARFTLTGKIAASGNLQSLNNWSLTIGGRFDSLFDGQTALTSAPLLPATHCLDSECYYRTFRGTSITEIDVWMQTMSQSTLNAMCQNCKQLEKATIRTTNIRRYSHYALFYNCPKLREIAIYNTSWGDTTDNCFNSWIYNISKTGTIYISESLPIEYDNTHRLPYGWSVKTHEELADTTKWRNFAKDGGSIPMLGSDVTAIENNDWEMFVDFEIFDNSSGGTIFTVGYGSGGVPVLSVAVYAQSQATWSFNAYVPTSKITDVAYAPSYWHGGSGSFVLVNKNYISSIGRHRLHMTLVGNTLTYEMNGYSRTATVERRGGCTNPYKTIRPSINGHIYKLTIKDLTTDAMLLDVDRSYLVLKEEE